MDNKKVLRGVSTINFYATEHSKAVEWYTDFLKTEPYFRVTGYAEFRIGDFQQELGIVDSKFAPNHITEKPTGVTVYWHVDDLQKTIDKLISLGATVYQATTDRGNGFVTASFLDPFGNILGIMTNPHYIEICKTTNGD
ncbi:MAG: VOC family protein [Bacteroidetes bacterium]|nr:VOC family protein [Bacteroidota bacterium]